MIGTPFKSNDQYLQRKVNKINKKPWEQEARDDQGRRRFHGAFTGGFSAGYFNTVGSKEGWKPSNYDKSSTNSNVLNFMDEEDIQNQIGVHTITSKDEYKDVSNHIFHMSKKEANNLPIPGGEILLTQFLPKFNNIQNNLLQEAGLEDINSNVIVDDNRKYFKGPLEFKDNYQGWGYVDESKFEGDYNKSSYFNKQKDRDKNIIKMNYFDDEPELGFYGKDDKAEYTFEETILDDEEKFGKTKKSFHLDSAPNFIKSKCKLQMASEIKFEMPKLPENYDPFGPSIKSHHKESGSSQRKANVRLNPDKRSELIEGKRERSNFLETKFQSSKPQIASNPKPPTGVDQISSYFDFKSEIPFKDNIAKVSRFAKFIAEKEGLLIGEGYYNVGNLMSASEIKEEKILFEKLYEQEQELKASQDKTRTDIKKSRGDAQDNVSEVTREKVKWAPDKMLCKRFNLKDPYENLLQTGSISSLQKQIMKEEGIKSAHHDKGDLKSINNEKNALLILNTKPDVNLFEEIFGK